MYAAFDLVEMIPIFVIACGAWMEHAGSQLLGAGLRMLSSNSSSDFVAWSSAEATI